MASEPGPINQPSVVISDALSKFIGTEETVPQDDAVKYLWDYIKANQLEVWMDGSAFLFAD
jgi:upstream activation factor subunit UAF30